MKTRSLVYLALPYTFNGEKSFDIANIVAAKLMNEGNIVFSPISHAHHISDYLDPELKYDQEFWMGQDLPMLSKCDKLAIVHIGIDGPKLIENSKGCQSELKHAKTFGIPVEQYYYEEVLQNGETVYSINKVKRY